MVSHNKQMLLNVYFPQQVVFSARFIIFSCSFAEKDASFIPVNGGLLCTASGIATV